MLAWMWKTRVTYRVLVITRNGTGILENSRNFLKILNMYLLYNLATALTQNPVYECL